MTRRCQHEIQTKADYPDDRICQKCQTIWHISDYMDWTAKQMMTLPVGIRFAVLSVQAEKFVKADDKITVNEAIGIQGDNATCKACGRVEMPFEGFFSDGELKEGK